MPRGIAAGASMVLTGAVLVGRFDPRMLVAIGLILTGLGNVMLGWLDLTAGFWNLAWPGVISGLGMGLFFVPMSTLAFQNIGQDWQDEAAGICGVTRSIGSSIGIAIGGWQVASRMQFHNAALAAGITPFNPAVGVYLAPLGLDPQTPAGAAASQHAGLSGCVLVDRHRRLRHAASRADTSTLTKRCGRRSGAIEWDGPKHIC